MALAEERIILRGIITARAHQLWMARGQPEGSSLSDWLQAETDVARMMSSRGNGAGPDPVCPPASLASFSPSEHGWDEILRTVTDYITVVDRGGTVLYLNHPAPGSNLEDVVGTNVNQHLLPEHHVPFHGCLQAVFRTGEATNYEVAVELPRTGEICWFSTRMDALRVGGEVTAAVCVSTDITERKKLERRLATMHVVLRSLATASEISQAASPIIQTICESLRWVAGAFWMLEPHSNVLRCADFWHNPTVHIPGFKQATRECTFAKGIGLPGRIWANRQPAWIRDVTQDANFPRSLIASRDGLHAACGFPVESGNQFYGVVEFFSREIQEPDHQVLQMMASIGSELAQFIEHRRVERSLRDREREFATARAIQGALLPKSMPTLPGLIVSGATRFMQETGGDYFDFFDLSDGSLGITVGDASGHGIGAAILMTETRAALRAMARTAADPRVLLTLLNQSLSANITLGCFVTLFLARLDPRQYTLTYCSAGHCSGYILNRDGKMRAELESTNLPMGIDPTAEFHNAPPITLQQGDLVFLLTDGVFEARSPDGAMFGIERAVDLARAHCQEPPADVISALVQALTKFTGQGNQRDDFTAVAIKRETDA